MSSGENAAVKPNMKVKEIVLIGIMAAVCCVLGPWSIPIGAIPVSLQVVAVCLCSYVLGAKKGTLAVVIYILLGLAGLPVFSGFSGGAAKLLGPTGGYIIGFIFMAFISGFFVERYGSGKIYMQVIGLLSGLAVCYLFGTVWFAAINTKEMNFSAAFAVCVYPFIPFDLLKLAVCVILGNALRKALSRLTV